METRHAPRISVIVPVYNAEKTLERCVCSILSQSFTDFELLLVDDGSTDASAEICNVFKAKDGRVKVFHKTNKGVSSARNEGLGKAEGEFIAFCDSDDMVEKNWLSSMYEVSGNAGMVVCGYNLCRPGIKAGSVPVREPSGSVRIFSQADEILEKLLRARLLQFVWNKLFRRSIIEKAGLRFKEEFTIFEDEYFVLDYLRHITDVVCIPECGYDYYLPADFYDKYDFGIDAFQQVVNLIYEIVADLPGKIRLPSIVYWYKIALGRYASGHGYAQTKEKILFARRLASDFHDGLFNHIMLRIMPPGLVYIMVKHKRK